MKKSPIWILEMMGYDFKSKIVAKCLIWINNGVNEEPLDGDISSFEDEEIKQILKEALSMKLVEKRKIPRRNQLNVAIASTLGEFLGCFRLMGFDIDGNPTDMIVFHNKLEKHALDLQFMEKFSDFMVNRK